MIRYLYKKQSHEKRKQLSNRIYILCEGSDNKKSLELKYNFELIDKQVKSFMDYIKEKRC